MYDNKEQFDLTEIKGKYTYTGNQSNLGKFKDESKGDPINEFIGLKSKMYNIKFNDMNIER